MTIPPTFTFSQAALQSYVDCPRQFWLAWLKRLPWPATRAMPALENERRMRLGAHFHRLVERVQLGIIDDAEPMPALEAPLAGWFDAWRQHRPTHLPSAVREVECTLSTPVDLGALGQVRLLARYDLIAAEPGRRVVIVDWKTNDRPATEAQLLQRTQSAVYPFVLVEASAGLTWGPVAPDTVEMLYWFAAAPDQPVRLVYDAATHEANRRRLTSLLADIAARREEEEFPLVADTPQNRRRLCRFCLYRSRCDRGEAGSLADAIDDELALDESTVLPSLDAVEELAF